MAKAPVIPWDVYQRQRQQPQTFDDPIQRTLSTLNADHARDAVLDGGDPERVARANVLGREVDEHPALIEDSLDDVQRGVNARKMADLAARDPALGKWGQTNPRGMAAASDDHKALGILGGAWDFLKNAPGRVGKAGGLRIAQYATGLYNQFEEAKETILSPFYAAMSEASRTFNAPFLDPQYMLDDAAKRRQRDFVSIKAAADAQAAKYKGANRITEGLLAGTESAPMTALAMLTRDPKLAAGVMGGLTGGNAYQDARAAGKDVGAATIYSLEQGVPEAAFEMAPAAKLLSDVAGKLPVGKVVGRYLAEELPSEMATQLFQSYSEWQALHPEKPIDEWVAGLPEEMQQTALGVIGGGTVTAVTVKALQHTADVAGRVSDRYTAAQTAKREQQFFSEAERAAVDSKLRARDPEAYNDLIRAKAEDAGVSQVLVPAEAIRAYQQSDSYDAFDDPFGSFEDQIAEAEATGGDVVLPAEFALGTLPGTAAWSAIKDDLRLSPGGMSAREAQTFDEAMADVVARLSDEMAASDAETRASLSKQEKLIGDIQAKLQDAGFTPNAARSQAELIAIRIATRAARMGQEVTGREFDATEVRQVLPPALAEARKADATDLVINALRKGGMAAGGQGPSLLEWIAKRGGVEDRGGDIAAMGGDKWHRGRVGRRRLLKAFDEAQGNMLGSSGANANSLGNLLDAAISEGYFPDLLAAREAGEKIDDRVLIDAIGQELAGSPLYAREAQVDPMRAAADELAGLLGQRGIDPAGLSDAELRAEIDRLSEAGVGGYEQLADTLDIDGVQRPTRNSEGMPLAGTKEGVRAFWKWFGESKVVDEEGRPLVVYHGTNQPIDAFSTDRLGMSTRSESANYGFFFTSDPYVAGLYANSAASKVAANVDEFERKSEELQRKVERLEKQAARTGNWDAYEAAMMEWEALEIDAMRADDSGQNIVPAYLAISDLVVMDFEGEGILKLDGGFGKAIKAARDGGRGGLFLKNIDDTPGETRVSDHYVAFSPTQIKSINNRGTFDPADARILYQSAYHGSPHIFDRFSLDAIGTGEGAQAYGWGLYFAGRKEIAEHYRKALTGDQWTTRDLIGVNGQRLTDDPAFQALPGAIQKDVGMVLQEVLRKDGDKVDAEFIYAEFRDRVMQVSTDKWQADRFDQGQAYIASLPDDVQFTQLPEPQLGRLYKVEIPDDDEYLLWDKPLSEQPAKVRDALVPFGYNYDRAAGKAQADALAEALSGNDQVEIPAGSANPNGDQIYQDIARKQINGGWGPPGSFAERLASLALRDAGIAGIKYLDGGSRSQGEGSYNYVVFDDSRVSIQAYEQEARGRIMFNGPQTVIELFQGRNLSTLIHELGHSWLEELRIDATSEGAPDQLKQDWQTVQDWFAANGHAVTDGMIPTEAHEMWARGTERYLMEGKAPSTALQRLFDTFRGWLISIYKTVDKLRSPITPEIREVFDRLIATDDEIMRVREAQALEPLFKDAASIGMTGAEYDAYTGLVSEARGEAQGKLLEKTMNTIRRRVTKQWNDDKRALTDEIAPVVNAMPIMRALDAMKTQRVSREWIVDNMGVDALSLLPVRVPAVYVEGGVHPDTVAEEAGFGSGREMLDTLIGAERQHREAKAAGDQRTMRNRMIEDRVNAEMASRYGDPFSDGSIEREALAVVNGEMQGEVIAAEIRVLARRSGKRATPYQVARTWARQRIRRGTYATEASPAAIQRHARAVAKAGTEAQNAMLKGDTEAAFVAKQRQMLSSALLAEAKAANDEVESARKRMDKIARRATSKSIDQDYLDQAHALLEAVDLRERSQRSIDRFGKWSEWAQARAAEGFDIVVPDSFEGMLNTNWSRLPIETLLGLDEAVAQVIHLGRLKQTLLDNKERREFDAVVDEAVRGAGNLQQKPPRGLVEPGWFDRFKAGVANMDAALLKMETVFDWLDGGNSNGVFNRIAFRPIADAQARENDMLADYYGRIKALFSAVDAKTLRRWSEKVTTPFVNRDTGRPEALTRQQVIAMALNVGNEGNLQRLADGYGWNAGAIETFLNETLTAQEWQFVQGVWDTIDTLWPEIEGLEKRVNGIAPEKVEARAFDTPHGPMRGGYYPAVYDSTRDLVAEEHRGKEADLFQGNYTRASTRASSAKARSEQVSRPILLDIGVINRHLGEVIHDITHREAVMQAHKFLTDRRVMAAVDSALGIEIRQQFRPWVKFVANSWAMERAGNEGLGKFFGKLRANATVVGMGFRVTTMLTQAAGYSNSIEVVGGKWIAEAIARVSANPIKSFEFVMERSGEVRHRMDTLDRDVRNAINGLDPLHKLGEVKRFAFHGIGYMDRVVVIPTWIGAYNKALSEGMAEQEAIYAADKAVRLSQGAGSPKDMAAITRGTGKWGELLKIMTMFYSYFSAAYQRERTLGRDMRAASARDMPRLAARAWWLLVVPPLLTELIKASAGSGGPDDDEAWAGWTFKKLLANALGPIPFVRDLFEPAWDKAAGNKSFGYSMSPLQRVGDTFVNVAGDAGRVARGEETKHATKDVLEATGYATGLVPGQLASASQFLVDVGNGDARPQDLSDWIEGLSTGKIKDK